VNGKSNVAKSLLLRLISASSEDEVRKIIEDNPTLSKQENWKSYGGYHGNFNTIHNQQQNPVASLAEKPINSIDHLLLKECKLRGINPEGNEAPKSMQEAVELFYGIKKGDFSEVGGKKRRELANNIMMVAEGSRERPNIVVADTGEGQHPSDFEDTFVSLHKGNKDKIRFVQGKYNMGGTGVLAFCGEYHYQLILSRKTPSLLQPNQGDEWGFTLVRLHSVTSSEPYKNSWYEYCVDENGEILSFPGEVLNILPTNGGFTSGTYIKMFNYYLPDPSIVGFGLWRELNRLLYAPALPLTLYEARDYRGHSPTKLMLGNKMRITVDDRDSVDQSSAFTAELGKFGKRNIEVIHFKEGMRKSEFTTQDNAIFFTINGQTHATLGRSFLKTKAKLYYLADYLLVHIDCTDVEPNIREQTFMPDRERMRRNPISKEEEEILADELAKDEWLQQLNQFRREQQVIKNPKDTEFLENVVSNLIKNNRSLINYLGLGGGVKDVKQPGPKKIERGKYEGKRFPTYLKILSYSKDKLYRKQIPVNSYARLKLETDAANDYFYRETENGELKMKPDIMKSFHLWNGKITIKLMPPQSARVGQIQRITTELTRPYSNSLFVNFEVEYVSQIQTRVNPHGEKKDEDKVKEYKLPEPILVREEKRDACRAWTELDPEWTREDVAKVAPSGATNGDEEGLDIFINMDANVLHDYLRRQQVSERQQELIERAWETSVFLNSLVLYNDLSKLEREDILPDIMKSISKITLDLMRNESLLKELEQA
jgi:hypothetical protein